MRVTESTALAIAVEDAGVSHHFGDVRALDDVSFTVEPGEIFGLLGPDGAGKTTLIRILATLLVADLGSARVLGREVVSDFWALRARLGYMPGRFSLYPDLSVRENLDFFASVFGTTVEEGYSIIAPAGSARPGRSGSPCRGDARGGRHSDADRAVRQRPRRGQHVCGRAALLLGLDDYVLRACHLGGR